MKKLFSKEVKIGIAFIVALLILYMGINFLKGVNIFKPANTYTIVFDDVSDLTISTPILLNGYQVGLVRSMELDTENNNKINVEVNLNEGLKIPKGSTVRLDVSMMGNASIIIKQKNGVTDYYTPEDKIQGSREAGLMEAMGGALPQIDQLIPKIDSILIGLNLLVQNPALVQSLQNVNTITQDMALASKQLNQMMTTLNRDMPQLTRNMTSITNNLDGVSKQFNSMNFADTYNSLDATMKNVESLTKKLNSKENSLGLLLNDRNLYDNLNQTVGSANQLMEDMKKDPSKYINVKVF